MNTQPFNPAAWAAQHVDLLHPPSVETYRSLTELSVHDLNQVYHTLSTIPASPVWQDYVWDTFTEMIERELALEL